MSARAVKCIFLGYSRFQKRYCCYSSSTNCTHISVDVTFFEDTPYFTSLVELDPLTQVLPIPHFAPSATIDPSSQVGESSSQPISPLRPLVTYQRWRQPAIPEAKVPSTHDDSSPAPSSPPAPDLPDPSKDLHIALCKGNRSTCNFYPFIIS